MMTNTIRALLALCTPALVLACTLLSACAPAVRAPVQAPTLEQVAKLDDVASEALCSASWEAESDGWWECYVAENTRRCMAHGWCSE